MTTENKRDLAADLAICEAATPGPWLVDENAANQIRQPNGSKRRRITTPPDADGIIDAKFIATAREGWPESIRRAMAAEKAAQEFADIINVKQAEVERLEAFIQHESELAIEAAQEIIRLRKDKLRLHDVYDAQYARATEYWGEVERLRKENDRLRAQLGLVDGDMRDFTDEESAAYEAALDRLFAEGDDADDAQENNGR